MQIPIWLVKPEKVKCLNFSDIVKKLKLLKSNQQKNSQIFSKSLYKGACIKIINSQKTYQVIGINPKNNICWIREWPFDSEFKKTFALEISQISLQMFCSNKFLD